MPDAKVFAVEPEGFDDTARSLAAGRRLGNVPGARSICDALQAPMPGLVTFPINQARLGGSLTVSDSETLAAMRIAFEDFGLVAEPGGAVALAAALTGRYPVRGRTVVVALTGANVDAAVFARALQDGPGMVPQRTQE